MIALLISACASEPALAPAPGDDIPAREGQPPGTCQSLRLVKTGGFAGVYEAIAMDERGRLTVRRGQADPVSVSPSEEECCLVKGLARLIRWSALALLAPRQHGEELTVGVRQS